MAAIERTSIETVINAKRQMLEKRKARVPLDAMRALASMQRRPDPILSTVTDHAEVMLFGQVRYNLAAYDPVAAALHIARAGLDGVALFTDNTIYDGGANDLTLITRAVSLPAVMQNYIFDEYQIVEARAAGASAVRLVAGLLPADQLRRLISVTQRNRMTSIVRVSSTDELQVVMDFCPSVIEVGGRDPETGILLAGEIGDLCALLPHSTRLMICNRLRSFDEALAIAPLLPDAVMISERLLAQPDAVKRLRAIFSHSEDA